MWDEFDAIIDDAIKSYAAAEPSPDLAANLLRRAQSERLQEHKGWKLAMAFALPVAAAVALAVVLVGRLSLPQAPVAIATVPAVPVVHGVPVTSAKAAKPAQTRLRKFKVEAHPLPAPYTKQELALLAFVEQYPKEAAKVAEEQSRPLEPLSRKPIAISRLEVAPLTIASLDQEK